jgi:hypothetical protein
MHIYDYALAIPINSSFNFKITLFINLDRFYLIDFIRFDFIIYKSFNIFWIRYYTILSAKYAYDYSNKKRYLEIEIVMR